MLMLKRAKASIFAAMSAWKAGDSEHRQDAIVTLDLSHALLPLVDAASGTGLVDLVSRHRASHAKSGNVLPRLRIRDDQRLGDGCFVVRINGEEVCCNHVVPSRKLAVDASFQEAYLNGTGVWEPLSGQPGIWIEESRWAEMAGKGFTLLTPAEVVVAHVVAAVFENMSPAT